MRRLRYFFIIAGITLFFTLLFWIGESLFSMWYLNTSPMDRSFAWVDTLLSSSPYIWFIRLSFLVICLFGTTLLVVYVKRLHDTAQALSESERKYRAVFENAPVGICVDKLDGEIVTANSTLYEMIGDSSKLSPGTYNITEMYVNPEDRAKLLQELKSQGFVKDYAAEWQHRDKTTFHASLTVLPVTLGGESMLMTVVQDISKHVKTRELLLYQRAMLARQIEERTAQLIESNAELVQAARLRDEFLSNMTHELRTPLTLILTFTEMLQQELYGPLGSRQREILLNIEENGQQLLSLITDILDVSKIEIGKLKLHKVIFFVRQVCQESLQAVKSQARKKEITVFSNLDVGDVEMQGDEQRIKQILINLLSNAIKFTPEGGQVGLDARVEDVGLDDAAVHFTVWDTGIGISPDDRGRLFEPFTQLDGSITRQYGGAGLGLALVAHLTRLHGGFISLDSHVGEGSRFTVSLPLHPEVSLSEAAAPEDALSEDVLSEDALSEDVLSEDVLSEDVFPGDVSSEEASP